MKKALIAILFCLSAGFVLGQTNGSYRSRQSGDWNQVTTWQVFNFGWNNLESAGAGSLQNVIPSHIRGVITISSGTTVTVPAGLEITADQLEFGQTGILQVAGSGTSKGILNINNGTGHDVRLFNNGTNFSQLLVSGYVRLLNNATIVNDNYAGTVIPASNATTFNTYKILNGGFHLHASADPLPYADYQTGSAIYFYATSANPTITDPSIQFYNFVWEGMAQTQNLSFNGSLRNVNGSLTVNSTNGRVLTFGNSTSYTLNIARNLRIAGNSNVTFNLTGNLTVNVGTIPGTGNFIFDGSGTVNLASTGSTTLNALGDFTQTGGSLSLRQATSEPGAVNLNISGNFSQTGGSLYRGGFAGSANINFVGASTNTFTKTGGTIFNSINYSIANGKILNLGTSTLTGSGSLTLATGGTLGVGALDAGGAIQNSTLGGNIRITGARTYQSGSTIVYNGAGTQFIGAGHPAAPNTTVANADAVYLIADVTINGVLDLQVSMVIGAHTLTMGGTITDGNGFLGVTSLSNVIVNGTGNFGTLRLAPVESQSPPNPMNNLTINRSGGGIVTLGEQLIVGGTFALNNGTFLVGVNPGWALTLRGPFTQASGTLSFVNNPIFVVEGAGVLPASVNITGTGLEKLTMDRVGRTFSTNAPLTITDSLNLFNGTVNHPGIFTMGDEAVVVRRSGGLINQLLNATGLYDVVYDVASGITTGNELPTAAVRLANLTKTGTATVLLNRDIVVNGSMAIDEGVFDVGIGNDISIRNHLVVDGSLETQEGLVNFIGDSPQNISGTAGVTFFNLALSQAPVSTLNFLTNVSIENNFTINSTSTVNAGTDRLRLLSTAARTANVTAIPAGASIVGRVIVNRFLPNTDGTVNYRYMSSPVSNSTFPDWTSDIPITKAFRYNEPTRAYVPYSLSGVLPVGMGFSVGVNSASLLTYDTRGTLNQGNISIPLTSQSSNVTSPDGFNLVGNPYPSAISWLNINLPGNGSIFNAVYVTDNFNNSGQGSGVFAVSYVDGVSTPAGFTGQIAQGQAFWVKATANTTLNLTEAAKITATNTKFYREEPITNLLRITIDGKEGQDETVLRIREGATAKFDPKYDAQRFFELPLSLSSLTNDNVKAVINAFDLQKCNRSVPLITQGAVVGNYRFGFTGLESFDSDVSVYLIDAQENKTIDLRKQEEYSFEISDQNLNSLAERFRISFERKGADTMEDMEITKNGSILTSSAEEGNQWYLNDVVLEGETSNTLVASEPGIYTLSVTKGGCTSTAMYEVLGEEFSSSELVSIYPNPTSDKVMVRVKTTNSNVNAFLVNATGAQIDSKELTGNEGEKSGEFDLIPYSSGIFYLRIVDGSNIFIRKVSKVK